MIMPNPTILAIDPGLRELGYAVLRGRRLLACGAVGLKRIPRAKRLGTARRLLGLWVRTHRPSAIVVEKTYPHPLPWLNELHGLSRSAQNLATRTKATYATYSPQSVRASVLGNGRATKAEVALAIAHQFPSMRVYLTQDRRWKERFWRNAFDALAIALHHQTPINPSSRSR